MNVTASENEIDLTRSPNPKISLAAAYVHGAHLVFLDGLGSGMTGNRYSSYLE